MAKKRKRSSTATIEAVIAAYHGPKTADEIARAFKLSGAQRVYNIWQQAKDAGLITGSRKFQIVTDETGAAIADTSDATYVREDDDAPGDIGPPIASPWGIRIPDPDPLLMALGEAFGPDYRPPCVAAKLLEWEKDSGTIHEPGEVITAEDAMIMARNYDRLTRAHGGHSPAIDYEVGEIVLRARKARREQAERASRGV